MNDSDDQLSTILSKVSPTVVVRRRVYEVAKTEQAAVFVDQGGADEDDDGPPSSVNVARALASLRGDELRRLEEILEADEAEEPAAPAAATPAPARVLKVGETITVPELAKRMGVGTEELVTTLVAGGFFSTTRKSVLTRANATAAAWMFGWVVEPA